MGFHSVFLRVVGDKAVVRRGVCGQGRCIQKLERVGDVEAFDVLVALMRGERVDAGRIETPQPRSVAGQIR
jgi:hypothetical protein